MNNKINIRKERKKRCKSLLILLCVGFFSFQFSNCNIPSKDENKSNIILILTDQLTASALDYLGTQYLKVPNIKWLLDNGKSFSRAYCSQPLCTPSRVSMFTGKYPHKTTITCNAGPNTEIPKSYTLLGKAMKDGGYKTGYVGKWHLPVDIKDSSFHGFDYIVDTKRHNGLDSSVPKYVSKFLKKQKQSKPFFLVTSFVNPHDICEWARGDSLRMNRISASIPSENLLPPLPSNYAIPDSEPSVLRDVIQKSNLKTYPVAGWDSKKWREYRWAYNRLIEKVDAYIGLILSDLRKNNLLKNTIIVFTSDHGDGYAAHQWNQKQVLYEESIKIPFVIVDPKNKTKRASDNHLINVGVDLYPTICRLGGVSIPKGINGADINEIEKKSKVDESSEVVVETTFCDNDKSLGVSGRALITARYKYIVYNKGKNKEQLFDLMKDPGEENNLAIDKGYKVQLEKMRKRLKKWCKRNQDGFYKNLF